MELHVECLAREARLVIGPESAEKLRAVGKIEARKWVAHCVEICKRAGGYTVRADLSDGSRGGIFSLSGHPKAIANLIVRELLW